MTETARGKAYLNAIVSDPDGDDVIVRWFSFPEAETLGVDLVENGKGYRASFTVPKDAQARDTIHLLAKVIDKESHGLVHYQRVIITMTI